MDGQGKRRCGGEGCDGLVSLAHNSWQKAQDFDKEITSAMEEVEKLSKMVRGAQMLNLFCLWMQMAYALVAGLWVWVPTPPVE